MAVKELLLEDMPFLVEPFERTFWWKDPESEAGIHDSVPADFYDANCVSSLTNIGWHAPVLDLDYRVSLGKLAGGHTQVYLDQPMSENHIRDLRAELNRLGFSPKMDDLPLLAHRPTFIFRCPIALVSSSNENHFHLYLNHEISWPEFDKLLLLMADAGMINRNYWVMSHERQMAMLRMPGVYKRSSGRKDGVVYTYDWSNT